MTSDRINELFSDENLSPHSKEKLLKVHEIISKKNFSDILDDEGNQYVNFVQEGGGVWGVALVGYLYALESFGIRFLRIAGTSAGAINTVLIAALGERSQPKSKKIKEILFEWNFLDFMDGKSVVKKYARKLLQNKNFVKNTIIFIIGLLALILVFPFLTLIPQFSAWYYVFPFSIFIYFSWQVRHYYHLFRENNIGLNPGKTFESALKKALDDNQIYTIADLDSRYNQSGSALKLKYRYGNTTEYYEKALEHLCTIRKVELANLSLKKFDNFYQNAVNNVVYKENPFTLLRSEYAVITTDINSKIKVEFPKMAGLYWTHEELSKTSPARFVRASMSVPYFFEPLLVSIDTSKESIINAWNYWLNAKPEAVCKEAVFIDGGSISNFPIDIFHESDIFFPRIPVFGVRLIDKGEKQSENGAGSKKLLRTPLTFLGAIFDTLRGYNDKSFLTKYTFYSTYSIQVVDCSPSNWLNFFMEEKEKNELFNKGFVAGLEFLEGFDWEKYRNDRMLMALKEKNILKQESRPNYG